MEEESIPKGKGLSEDAGPVGGLGDRQRRALLAKSEHLGGCGSAALLGHAQGERGGCLRDTQVGSWQREGAMAGPRQGAWPAAPISGVSSRACTRTHPHPGHCGKARSQRREGKMNL